MYLNKYQKSSEIFISTAKGQSSKSAGFVFAKERILYKVEEKPVEQEPIYFDLKKSNCVFFI